MSGDYQEDGFFPAPGGDGRSFSPGEQEIAGMTAGRRRASGRLKKSPDPRNMPE